MLPSPRGLILFSLLFPSPLSLSSFCCLIEVFVYRIPFPPGNVIHFNTTNTVDSYVANSDRNAYVPTCHTGKYKTPSYILQWDGTAFTTNCPVHTDSVVNFRLPTASNGQFKFLRKCKQLRKNIHRMCNFSLFWGEGQSHFSFVFSVFLSFFVCFFFLFFHCIFHFSHDNADSMNDILVWVKNLPQHQKPLSWQNSTNDWWLQ